MLTFKEPLGAVTPALPFVSPALGGRAWIYLEACAPLRTSFGLCVGAEVPPPHRILALTHAAHNTSTVR